MTCENCIHYSLCESQCRNQYENGECAYCYRYFCEVKNTAEKCPSFKDKSLYINLPCKVGDTVYLLKDTIFDDYIIFKSKLLSFEKTYNYEMISCFVYFPEIGNARKYYVSEIGKTVFLTKEEAEQALKERDDNGKQEQDN